jgi:hypothetical protein|tara:strand:- start:291 stop:530 length:240 start_codon:yes stop_codon:yes gene_type:complete
MENLKNYSNEPIGEWKIGDEEHFISFALKTKPNWFHRLCARIFFGLRWYDFKVPTQPKPSKGIKIGKYVVPKPVRRFKG